jgi:hypothetical protein
MSQAGGIENGSFHPFDHPPECSFGKNGQSIVVFIKQQRKTQKGAQNAHP